MSNITSKIIGKIEVDFLHSKSSRPGQRLPAIRSLARKYSSSTATVSKAIEVLASNGLLDKKRGNGIFIAERPAANGSDNILNANGCIGFVCHNLDETLAHRVLKGVESEVNDKGKSLILSNSNYNCELEKQNLQKLYDQGISGVVLYPSPDRNRNYEYLADEFRDIFIVVVDMYHDSMKRSHVVFDNYSAGYEMTKYILSLGRNRIAIIKYDDEDKHYSLKERYRGYCKVLDEAGLSMDPAYQVNCGIWLDMKKQSLAPIYKAVDELLSYKVRPEAIIAPMDFCARIIIEYLAKKGVKVPEDILVVGFDNDVAEATGSIYSESSEVLWPTTRPNFERMGSYAAKMLLEGMEDKEINNYREVVLPCPLLLPKVRVL